MKKRLQKLSMLSCYIGLLVLGGWFGYEIYIGFSDENAQKLIHDTGGFIGFIFGLMQALGALITAILIWVISGITPFSLLGKLHDD